MTKYSSSSSFSSYEAVIASLVFLGIGIVIANSSEIIWIKVISILISIGIVILIILYQRKRTFDIKFLENEIIIKYPFLKKTSQVPYVDLLQIEFISAYRTPNRNRIKFKIGNKIESLRFLTVAQSDQYIEFIKWLKSKNDKLELKVFPSDHIINHKIQEVYGLKYRKILKKTL
ncbi:hypothetical protein IU405_11545 [Polaribacter sp. BAL334]|uniref:hypothetical protein n=1 Tax=Polaribacter sp. BAL334 TaxID=1708178 RepID=UPI0018D21DC1|nr:hypothetical protein [Polaribacter sp. BAL334]MBG7612880.1 hypothetical protein [Polaribacter sp. BAL334]